MTSRSYFGKMNSILGSVVPLAMFEEKKQALCITNMHANYSRGQFRITPSVKKVIGFSEVTKKLASVVYEGGNIYHTLCTAV